MNKYNVIVSCKAQEDIDNYIDCILYEYSAEKTAEKHFNGIFECIKYISKNAETPKLERDRSLPKIKKTKNKKKRKKRRR